ncbi:DUF4065 domain-containing protein [Lysinibacillus agricola]|nr:type II toxin-antitoxin system antitoxin SocA domain-containing protein [Lysinibacillus agricola]QQP11561.1 DUF4065 domain-containing protein [Lysinibacillus agricola]
MVRPYDANTIADFVIQDSSSRGTPVSNLKLQKILYFLQAKYLTEFNKKLFHNEIQKWKYGPVVPDVYFRFDHYGASNIEEVPKEIDFSEFF